MGIGISILSTPRAIDFDSEDGLRAALRPGAFGSEAEAVDALQPDVDGVILQAEGPDGQTRRGLFLPQVWASLPDAQGFVARLKQKAGLAPDHWSDEIRAFRFTAETFKGKLDVRPEDTKPT